MNLNEVGPMEIRQVLESFESAADFAIWVHEDQPCTWSEIAMTAVEREDFAGLTRLINARGKESLSALIVRSPHPYYLHAADFAAHVSGGAQWEDHVRLLNIVRSGDAKNAWKAKGNYIAPRPIQFALETVLTLFTYQDWSTGKPGINARYKMLDYAVYTASEAECTIRPGYSRLEREKRRAAEKLWQRDRCLLYLLSEKPKPVKVKVRVKDMTEKQMMQHLVSEEEIQDYVLVEDQVR